MWKLTKLKSSALWIRKMQSCPRHKGTTTPQFCTLITGRILEEGAWDVSGYTAFLERYYNISFNGRREVKKSFGCFLHWTHHNFNLSFLEKISAKPLIMYTHLAPFSIVLLCIYWHWILSAILSASHLMSSTLQRQF